MIDYRIAQKVSRVVLVRLTIAALFSFGLGACAVGSRANKSGPDSVEAAIPAAASLEARAIERWRLLIDRQPIAAYEYLTPGYRSTVSRDVYAANQATAAITWIDASWQGADCDSAAACKAQIRIEYSVRLPGAGNTPTFNLQTENWLQIDGVWYFLPNQH